MNKPLKLEDFNLSQEDLKTLVEGSQKYLPPEPEDDTPLDGEEDPTIS